MARPRKDTHPIFVRTPPHLLSEIDRIAAEHNISRATVLLDAFRKQRGLPKNVFDEPERRPPTAAE